MRARCATLIAAVTLVLAAPAISAADDAPTGPTAPGKAEQGTFIYEQNNSAGGCLWGIGIEFSPISKAVGYRVDYWDGYWKQNETSIVTPSSAKPGTTDKGVAEGDYYVGVTGGGYSPPCQQAAGDPSEGGRFSKGATVTPLFAVEYHAVEGTVTALSCGSTGCNRKPVGGITVTATSGSNGTLTATTSADGTYKLQRVPTGSWLVSPSAPYLVNPVHRDIAISDTDWAGVNFTVCSSDQGAEGALPCFPEFDYSMPPRLSLTGEPTGKTASDYQPKELEVDAKVLNGRCDTSADYAFSTNGTTLRSEAAGRPCTFRVYFPKEGTYQVTAAETSSDSPLVKRYTRSVVVEDFLIVSVGDSMAAGEGLGEYTDYSQVGVSLCHRSLLSYSAQFAQRLESDDARSSVTYLPVACTGARIAGGSLEQDVGNQLQRAKALVGDRHVDALFVTIGVNDLDFATVLVYCYFHNACQDNQVSPTEGLLAAQLKKVTTADEQQWLADHGSGDLTVPTFGAIEQHLVDDLSQKYSTLSDEIRASFSSSQLDSSHVYFVAYPDPLTDGSGNVCPVLEAQPKGTAGGIATSLVGYELGQTQYSGGSGFVDAKEGEVTWAEQKLFRPLTVDSQRFASRYRYIPAPADFGAHDYCSSNPWWTNLHEALITARPTGVLHPNTAGEQSIAEQVDSVVLPILLPDGHATEPAASN